MDDSPVPETSDEPQLVWTKPICTGNKPSNRSGHSFTLIGTNIYLFGGCDYRKPPGPNNEMYILKLTSGEFEWRRLKSEKNVILPLPRWKHSTTLWKSTKLVVFGGFHSSNHRLNDVWIFDTITRVWTQPVKPTMNFTPRGNHVPINHNKSTKSMSEVEHIDASESYCDTEDTNDYSTGSKQGKQDTKNESDFSPISSKLTRIPKLLNVPSPRGDHSASLIGDRLYIFGGYGGSGYNRKDFKDLFYLDLIEMKWYSVSSKGPAPEGRSGHSTSVVNDRLYIFGGWSTSTKFNDLHVFNTKLNIWESEILKSSMYKLPRWGHSACSVEAIPHWKIFLFGGSGKNQVEDKKLHGAYSNDLSIYDPGKDEWVSPDVTGDVPLPRSDTELCYDVKNSQLVLFGGWANEWYGDIYSLGIASVVGPPYAITDLRPKIGAVTGNEKITIKGIDFTPTDEVSIRFAYKGRKGVVDVKGVFIGRTTLEVITPDFHEYGSGDAQVRVALNNDSFTTTYMLFNYFSVTEASNVVAFGPGVIDGCAAAVPTSFMIVARDKDKIQRIGGQDEFKIQVKDDEGVGLPETDIEVIDNEDGTYTVSYTTLKAGLHTLEVEFLGSFGGTAGHIAGSPFEITFEDGVSKSNNILEGILLLTKLKADIAYISKFTNDCMAALQLTVTNEDIKPLLKIKEAIFSISDNKSSIELMIEVVEVSAFYLKSIGKKGGSSMTDEIKILHLKWDELILSLTGVKLRIKPFITYHSVQAKVDLAIYEESIQRYHAEHRDMLFWQYNAGPEGASQSLDKGYELYESEEIRYKSYIHLARVMEFPELMTEITLVMQYILRDLNEMRNLWDTASEVSVFISESKEQLWLDVEAEIITEEATNLVLNVKALHQEIQWCDAFSELEKHAKNFLMATPCIASLRLKCIRDRHWRQMMKAVGQEFKLPDSEPDFLLGTLLDLNLHNYTQEIEAICEQAMKEENVETSLKKIQKNWEGIIFRTEPYDERNKLVMMSENDIETLEADLLTIQTMKLSSIIDTFDQAIAEWYRVLTLITGVVKLLVDVQQIWKFLEPLYIHSVEVKKELKSDAQRFKLIDENVRKLLDTAATIKNVKAVCKISGILSDMSKYQQQLDACKKSLIDFMEVKKQIFTRFYFVSQSDLLEIISNGSSPIFITQNYLPIVFPATKDLIIDTSNPGPIKADQWRSNAGEEIVDFLPPVYIEGKVEKYLMTIHIAMQSSLQRSLEGVILRYIVQNRMDWLMNKNLNGDTTDPVQIQLVVLSIYFSKEMEEALELLQRGEKNALNNQKKRQNFQLQDLIKLTRTDLSKTDRSRVMSALTLEFHFVEVVEYLVRMGIQNRLDYHWQSQLKYLWDDASKQVQIASLDASFKYGYEYQGNSTRLIITPLQDRFYINAMNSMHLKLGFAVKGFSGSGKTETTKDLAMKLGKPCYVFNCSQEMDYIIMGNLFKGIAASGSWACFEDFNRLVVEVLSVCTTQFKSICNAKRHGDFRLAIDGDTIYCDTSCAVVLTMNPISYGRSHLPEGLNTLFRPLSMTMPHLKMIIECTLITEGFQDTTTLSRKIFSLYDTLSKILPKRPHYNWGLRPIKLLLNRTGAALRKETNLSEDQLILRLLKDSIYPKIVHEDEILFNRLLKDLFPFTEVESQMDSELNTTVRNASIDQKLWPEDDFLENCSKLNHQMLLQRSIFIVGAPGSGKTECWKTLARARKLKANNIKDINPKAVTIHQLYGLMNASTREWKDGILPYTIKKLNSVKVTNQSSSNNAGDDGVSTPSGASTSSRSSSSTRSSIKSVSKQQLYEAVVQDPKWLILDGSLDCGWIELLNSAVDVNGILTLPTNERIQINEEIKLIFETDHLHHITPSTLSRVAVLWIRSNEGKQWRNLISGWIQRIDEIDVVKETLQELLQIYVEPSLQYIRSHNASHISSIEDIALVQTVLYMLEVMLKNREVVSGDTMVDVKANLEESLVFACVWAFGSTLGDKNGIDQRAEFSSWWRDNFKRVKIPSRDTIFDYYVNPETNRFELWRNSPYYYTIEFDSNTNEFSDIFVPTVQTCSLLYWLELLSLEDKRNCMLIGQTGVGKTHLIRSLLSKLGTNAANNNSNSSGSNDKNRDSGNSFNNDNVVIQNNSKSSDNNRSGGGIVLTSTVNFNYCTSSSVLREILEYSLEKKLGNEYGPPGEDTSLIYFIDDVNLPKVDDFGNQSAHALLRQHIDYGHWCNTNQLDKGVQTISNAYYIASMNYNVGSYHIHPRLQRHFVTFSVEFPDNTALLNIYSTILSGHLKYFGPDVSELCSIIVNAALILHTVVSLSFKKSANNLHYGFNIRHLSRIFQGLLMVSPEHYSDPENFITLWIHESERVYADALVTDADIEKYQNQVVGIVKRKVPTFNIAQYYSASVDKSQRKPLIFCHYAKAGATVTSGSVALSSEFYEQVEEMEILSKTLDTTLLNYNENPSTSSSTRSMSLILFPEAVQHICRLTRVLYHNEGHALLLGRGGLGKQSLSRLASFICHYECVEFLMSSHYGMADFKDELKEIYRKTGMHNMKILLIITENQITNEQMLVFIEEILTTGDVTDLFPTEEREAIIGNVKSAVKQLGIYEIITDKICWDYFISKVTANLHLSLCFDSKNAVFRHISQNFPSIISQTSINWFNPWSESTLHTIGTKALSDTPLGKDDVRIGVENFLPYVHKTVEAMAEKVFVIEKRLVHVPPSTYLHLLNLYNRLLTEQRESFERRAEQLRIGIDKLDIAEETIAHMEAELVVVKEDLKQKEGVEKKLKERLLEDKGIVAEATAEAENERLICENIKAEVEEKKKSYEDAFKPAEPMIERMEVAISDLTKMELSQMKTMMTAPKGVSDAFVALMCLFANVNIKDPSLLTSKGTMKQKSWASVRMNLLRDVVEVAQQILDFKQIVDSISVPLINIKEAKAIVKHPTFDVDAIYLINPTAGALGIYILNVIDYYEIVVTVEPKRLVLVQVTAEFEASQMKYNRVEEKRTRLQHELDLLQDQHNTAYKKKEAAQAAVDLSSKKLDLSSRLTNTLSKEKLVWLEQIEKLNEDYEYLVGDLLISAAFITYLGPFTKNVRDDLISNQWIPFLKNAAGGGEEPISMSSFDMNPIKLFVNDAEISLWNQQSLPVDKSSIENAVIFKFSTSAHVQRWPLLIDPQYQGYTWIKQAEAENDLKILSLNDLNFLDDMKVALKRGNSVLIENIEDHIDGLIHPLINRQFQIKGRSKVVMLGSLECEVHSNFKLVLHTNLRNPQFQSEFFGTCLCMNFQVTEISLEEQLLGRLFNYERKDLKEERKVDINDKNQFKIQNEELQEDIISKLSASKGDITVDVELIEQLEKIKSLKVRIISKLGKTLDKMKSTDIICEKYRSVAKRGSFLFFWMCSLYKLHRYYTYSLDAFLATFMRGIALVKRKTSQKKSKKKNTIKISTLRKTMTELFQTKRSEWNKNLIISNNPITNKSESNNNIDTTSSNSDDNMKTNTDNNNDDSELNDGDKETLSNSSNTASADKDTATTTITLKNNSNQGNKNNNEIFELTDIEIYDRCDKLISSITYETYNYVRMGIFEKDRLIVAARLTFQLLVNEKNVAHNEYNETQLDFFYNCLPITNSDSISGSGIESLMSEDSNNNDNNNNNTINQMGDDLIQWLSEPQWSRIRSLGERFTAWNDIEESMRSLSNAWRDWYNHSEPESITFPGYCDAPPSAPPMSRLQATPPASAATDDQRPLSRGRPLTGIGSRPTTDLSSPGSSRPITATTTSTSIGVGKNDSDEVVDRNEKSKTLTDFDKLLMLRILRPDRLGEAIKSFVRKQLGSRYVMHPNIDVEAVILQSKKSTPVLFILLPGEDPTPPIETVGQKLGFTSETKKYINVPLGHGQIHNAEAILKEYSVSGGWVFIQNCHLMPDWIPKLQILLQKLSRNAHDDFRCFLSAEVSQLNTSECVSEGTSSRQSTRDHPISTAASSNTSRFMNATNVNNSNTYYLPDMLVQKCHLVTNETPLNMKNKLKRSWDTVTQDKIDSSSSPEDFVSCAFAACLYHSLILGRRKFGSVGLSEDIVVSYQDLRCSQDVLYNWFISSSTVEDTTNTPAILATTEQTIVTSAINVEEILDSNDNDNDNNNNNNDNNNKNSIVSPPSEHHQLEQQGGRKKALSTAIPWKNFRNIIGKVIYGGILSSFIDSRVSDVYLKQVFRQEIFDPSFMILPGFSFCESVANHSFFSRYIDRMFPDQSTQLFGLHPNAEIEYLMESSFSIMQQLSFIEFGTTSNIDFKFNVGNVASSTRGGKSVRIRSIVQDILEKLPDLFDMRFLNTKFEKCLEEELSSKSIQISNAVSFTIVMLQECRRMNALLRKMKQTLNHVKLGLDGKVEMSKSMNDFCLSLLHNDVPGTGRCIIQPDKYLSYHWIDFPSRKPLASWIANLIRRIEQLHLWSIEMKLPHCIWLSGLFYPHSLLAAVKQFHTIKHKDTSYEELTITIKPTSYLDPSEVNFYPERSGIYIHGLFIENAKWHGFHDQNESSAAATTSSATRSGGNGNNTNRITKELRDGYIVDPLDKRILSQMPVMLVKAVQIEDDWKYIPNTGDYDRMDSKLYTCPVFSTKTRTKDAFVGTVSLPSKDPVSKWILAGVALLLEKEDM